VRGRTTHANEREKERALSGPAAWRRALTIILTPMLLLRASIAPTAAPGCAWDTAIGIPGADIPFRADGFQEEIHALAAAGRLQ
jgi:hypothetical protein